jgi:hypothetical protein
VVKSRSIVAVGQLCDRWHIPLAWLELAARRLRVRAALIINGVPHFDEADADRLHAEVLAIAAGQVNVSRRRQPLVEVLSPNSRK